MRYIILLWTQTMTATIPTDRWRCVSWQVIVGSRCRQDWHPRRSTLFLHKWTRPRQREDRKMVTSWCQTLLAHSPSLRPTQTRRRCSTLHAASSCSWDKQSPGCSSSDSSSRPSLDHEVYDRDSVLRTETMTKCLVLRQPTKNFSLGIKAKTVAKICSPHVNDSG